LDVSDYLLKPISFSRFLKACEKVSVQLNQSSLKQVSRSPSTGTSPENSFIYVQSGQKMLKVNFEDIYFIEGEKDYVRIWTREEKIMTLLSFKKLETLLPSPRFLRVHKSYLIAIDKISSIERNRAEILGEQIPIGKSYQRDFFEIIMKYKIN
jgi:DNA-binding LytR/AlgR family response regulator